MLGRAGALQLGMAGDAPAAPADSAGPSSPPAASPPAPVRWVDQGINLRDVSGKGIITSPFAAVSVESWVNLLPPCR